MRTGFKLSAANAAVQYQPKQNKIKHWSYHFKNPATQLLRPLYSSTFSALFCAMFTVAKGSIQKNGFLPALISDVFLLLAIVPAFVHVPFLAHVLAPG